MTRLARLARTGAFALAAGLLLAPRLVRAEGDKSAQCTVRVIHAIDPPEPVAGDGKPEVRAEIKIDPKIDRLRPLLIRPPFSSWHEFVLLEKKYLQLTEGTPQPFLLPNGKPASLTFVDHLPDQPGHPHRVRLQLQIGDAMHPALKTTFIVDEGGIVLQAGQRHARGMLILGTSCEKAH